MSHLNYWLDEPKPGEMPRGVVAAIIFAFLSISVLLIQFGVALMGWAGVV